MATLQLCPSPRSTARDRREASYPAVPADRVKKTLLEIAFVLHATRVVGRREEGTLPKKG